MTELVAGRMAVVTGGARGIGLAVVEAIAARGVAVLCVDSPQADFSAFEKACAAAGVAADHVGVDGLVGSPSVDALEWKRVLDGDFTAW